VEDLIPIGQFAAASRVSPKALRLYDENGLLRPARVDPESGYRFYRFDQLRTATTIRLLRACGMPLSEIRAFLEAPSSVTLELYERGLADELVERRRILRYLRNRLKEEPMFDVQTKKIEEQRYVSRTARVRIPELERFITTTIDELWRANDAAAPAFAIYHGEVNEDDDGPVEVGVPTAHGDRTLPESEVAYTTVSGSQCEFPEIIGAYDAIAQWVTANGRELAGSPREIYLSDPGKGEEHHWEIAWPIR
jgi:DNA-binding transcriptional MerR regulator